MFTWQEEWKHKLLPSLDAAASKINSGDKIFCGETVSISYNFLNSLYARREELRDVLIMYNFGVGMSDMFFEEDSKKSFRIISIFTSPVDRMSGQMGILEYHSCPYEYAVREALDVYDCDTMVLEVCPPDEDGYCNVGVLSAPFFKAMYNYPKQMKKKIAVINNMQSPAQGADDVIKVKTDWFDYLVEDNHEMPYIPFPEPTELEMTIGRNVMEYINDGDTVQIGMGGLGEAITGLLETKKDIKIYTEITVDSVIPAVECGAVTKVITCGCWGTPKIYEFVGTSPKVECRDLTEMLNPFFIGQNENIACINCTLMIDLLGQACSEAQGLKQYSSVGGSFGYLYGATRAKGGRSFICVRSCYTDFEGNSQSSIVPWLPEKSIVTTPKYLTMYVATEYGVADIFLRTNKDRIKRLIKIAHPDFKPWLKEQIVSGGQITAEELKQGELATENSSKRSGHMGYQELFETKISGESTKAWKEEGKKAVGYVCCHIPEEILYAADVLPVRLRATGCVDSSDAEAWMSSFSCSYARSILQYLMNGTYELDGIAQSQGCMMQARIIDNWEHLCKKNGRDIFSHFVGAPRINTKQSLAFFKAELLEFAKKLGEYSGHKVTDEALKAAVTKMNETRGLIAELYALRKAENPVVTGAQVLSICLKQCDTTIDEFNAMLKEFLADAKNRKPIEGRARIMVIGSALDNPEYIKVIEDNGGIVVADYNCFGDRAFGPELKVDDSDVMGSIAKYYLDRNTCPRELDNRPSIHKEIVDICKKYKVQGVIYQKMQNCECWGGESYYLEPDLKAIGIPMLQLEREEHMANIGQLSVRAEAFIEMLEK